MHQEEGASLDGEFCSISLTASKEKILVLLGKKHHREVRNTITTQEFIVKNSKTR